MFEGMDEAQLTGLRRVYEEACGRGLTLNMSRGVPGVDQLALSEGLLAAVKDSAACVTDGLDARSYGQLEGLPEARKLMGDILDVTPDEVILGGVSSLNLMYDMMARAMSHGVTQGSEPWGRQGTVKFICPAPGYDRHFALCRYFGLEMLPVPMRADGPDMDAVAALVRDPAVKGMWCVPKYSNPTGTVYSDETVRRVAGLTPAAPDFRVFWDNAYAVHDLYDEVKLLSVARAARAAGHPELVIQFASTAKITFPGGGISAVSAGPETLAAIRASLFFQTICYDKLNQLRHVRFLKDLDGVKAHMRRHAALLRPKFEAVDEILTRELSGLASWTAPRGGYFISLDVVPGTAKRTVELMKRAGVLMTGAGATWPDGRDPEDKNIRIAPTFPPVEELKTAMGLLCVCAKLAAAEV
ncbi:MAG: aminotransferase class I/II-fold pyridoxal phosphate-dependent enzyme [Oscillospiraceae bacterium]|jgi:DNA-binding transcriptional MocR family regulator|nr:aminotransferase class I/II-fold pyridoxal phosphate-dependent enzyme [Oscillospiraceae bacterium]